jgi:hypothetical protein
MVLLRITAYHCLEDKVDGRFNEVSIISIGEVDLEIATQIDILIKSNPKDYYLRCLYFPITLNSQLIIDHSHIAGIKACFNFETVYNNSSYNLIVSLISHLQYRRYDKFVDALYYNLRYADLGQKLSNTLEDINYPEDSFEPFEHQLSDVIGLLTLKHRISKYKNWEVGITKIIGTYLNSEHYKSYLLDFHPELY